MTIRRATMIDIPQIMILLQQILATHHRVRPDLFQEKGSKYTKTELTQLITDNNRPIFVYENEKGKVLGHLFAIIEETSSPIKPLKTLYIDDLCVDEAERGHKIGESLYQFALKYAKEIGCYNITLTVWSANTSAVRFYERQGMLVQKICMEQIISDDER